MKQSVLLKTAMLGTDRSSSMGIAPHELLEPVWQALEAASNPAQSLLQAAAIENLCQRAGTSALHAEPPPPCEPETKPYVSAAAANAFHDLVNGTFSDLASEWISVTQQSGLIATPRLLPTLLSIGDRNISLRAAVSEIVGNRGRWLANIEGKWTWLDAAVPGISDSATSDSTAPSSTVPSSMIDDELWRTGTPAQRRQWLRQQLVQNPELAAASVAASWPGDSPDTREMFTGLVAFNSHPVHEEWLQTYALCDRRQNTRQYAVRALMSIDNSAFRSRSLARAASVLSIAKKLIAKNQLDCQPPLAFDADWKQDGIKEKPPTGTGPRDYWLYQILSVIPLRDWPELVGHADPMNLKINSDWSETVLRAWQQAALTHPDTESVIPLLKRFASDKHNSSNMSAIASMVATIDVSEVADVLETLALPHGQCLEMLRRLLPPINLDRHPKLHKVASDWVFAKNQLTRPDAIALASCCDRRAIDALLTKIGKAKELSAVAEEFARALEYRQSYLKHFDSADKT